jgi:hypothetical protein
MASTWGQLRLLLTQENPGLSDDLIDGKMNARYEQILRANDWSGAKAHVTLRTTAAYQSTTDTVTFTVGSTAVTGVGTNWQSSQSGLQMFKPGDTVVYTATVNSTTSITLDRPYEGLDGDAPGIAYASSAYVLMQNVYTMPANCGGVISILDPVTGEPMAELSQVNFDQSVGPVTVLANPDCWSPYDWTPEGTEQTTRQVKLYPSPLYARGLPVSYRFAALGFDGVSTSARPLSWVSDKLLLDGANADLCLHRAKLAENPGPLLQVARALEAEFELGLAQLEKKEHMQDSPKVAFRMASRFTRHRAARVTRGRYNYWGPGAGGPS